MLKRILLIFFVFLLMPAASWAKEAAELNLSASATDVAVGESFQITIQMKSASTQGLNIGALNIPGIENFAQTGSSQSTQVEMVNGAMTAVSEEVLTLIPKQEGEFTIGPVMAALGNASVKSNEIRIKVSGQKQNPIFGGTNAAQNDERDTAEQGSESVRSPDFGWVVNIFALVLLVAMAYMFYARRRADHAYVQVTESGDGPAAIVLPDREDPKFFQKTKDILLSYLKERYKIDGESRTTQEVMQELKGKNVLYGSDIEKALKLCDQGSFALDASGKEELAAILQKIMK